MMQHNSAALRWGKVSQAVFQGILISSTAVAAAEVGYA